MDTQDKNTSHASNLKQLHFQYLPVHIKHNAVVERQFLKHKKFQTFFYDYAIASK